MKINAKLHCGIKTLIELAKCSDKNGLLQKDISINQEISIKFLDQIIASLKTAGLIVRASRKGGYRLTLDPSEITMYHIYRAFEPELNINQCLVDETICKRSEYCGARCFLSLFNFEMKKFMTSYTLKNLIDLEFGIMTKPLI